jgi:hypothetical protein
MATAQEIKDAKQAAAILAGENEPRWTEPNETEGLTWLGRWHSWDIWGDQKTDEVVLFHVEINYSFGGRVMIERRMYIGVEVPRYLEKVYAEACRRWQARKAA